MKFEIEINVENGTVTPDPDAAPESITAQQILRARLRQSQSDETCKQLVLALAAPVGETITCDLWHHDEATALGTPEARFYRVATGIVVTARQLQVVPVFSGGPIYVEVTADTLTAPQKLKATCVA